MHTPSRHIDPCAAEYGEWFLRHERRGRYCDPVTILTAVAVGAAVGAVGAAIQGGNILKGALMGAVLGGIGGAVASVLPAGAGAAGAAASTTGDLAAGVTNTIAGDAVSAAAGGAGEAASAGLSNISTGGGDSWLADAAGKGGGMQPSAAASQEFAAGVPSAPGAETPAIGGTGVGASQSSGTGFLNTAKLNSGLSGPNSGTALSGNITGNTALSAPGATSAVAPQGSGFLDKFLTNATGKDGLLSSKTLLDVGGRLLTGAAQGSTAQKNIQANIDARNALIANAKFGTTTSRYSPTGYLSTI